MRFTRLNERRLVLDIVERIGHENAVEASEWPRLLHEISTVREDLHSVVGCGNASENRTGEIDRVNGASSGQQAGQREGERAVSTSQIGPDRRPKCVDSATGQHLNRIARAHRGIIERWTA